MRLGFCVPRAPLALRLAPAGVQPIGRRDGEQPGAGNILEQLRVRLDRVGRHRALVRDGQRCSRRRRYQPVAASDDRSAQSGRERARGLRHRPRRQAQIHRAAVRALHPVEGMAHQHRKLVGIGRLESRQAGLRHADQRRGARLVRAAFGRQRDARRRRDKDEARILVAGIVHRIQPALDERVVQRADGQQSRAEQVARQAQRGQQQEQAVLRDAQLDMLALRRHGPALGREHVFLLEGVAALGHVENAAPIHPAAQVGGYGDVGRGGDDALGQLAVAAREIEQNAAEALLGRHFLAARHRKIRRHRQGRGAVPPRRQVAAAQRVRERIFRQDPLELPALGVDPGEMLPLLAVGDVHGALEAGHLFRVHQPGMVVLMPGERQAEAFDGVGDEAGRAVVLNAVHGLQHRCHVVPRQVGHQAVQRRVVVRVQQLLDAEGAVQLALQHLAPALAAFVGQRRVVAVGAIVDPLAQRVAAGLGESRMQQLAVFQRHDAPIHALEHAIETAVQAVGDDVVQALAVVVDHPPQVPDLVLPALEHRLEHVAFVELGVAHQGYHAARRRIRGRQLLRVQIVLRQRGEAGHRHAQPHGAGREIDVVAVFRARGIGLRAAQRAKPLQLVARLISQQVLDRMENGAGMRLYRHAVLAAQHVEIQRRHQRDDRSRRRLMAADLQPVAVRADMVGVMDGPGAEPQHLALQRR